MIHPTFVLRAESITSSYEEQVGDLYRKAYDDPQGKTYATVKPLILEAQKKHRDDLMQLQADFIDALIIHYLPQRIDQAAVDSIVDEVSRHAPGYNFKAREARFAQLANLVRAGQKAS